MSTRSQEIASQVRTSDQAKLVIAELFRRFATDTAFDRLVNEAQFAHQSYGEQRSRAAGNFLTSFVVRKPGGEVVAP